MGTSPIASRRNLEVGEDRFGVTLLTHITIRAWRLCTSPYQAVFLDCTSSCAGCEKLPDGIAPCSSCRDLSSQLLSVILLSTDLFVPLTYRLGATTVICTCTMSQNPNPQDNQSYPLRLPNYRFLHQGRYHPYPTFNRQQGTFSSENNDVEIAVCVS